MRVKRAKNTKSTTPDHAASLFMRDGDAAWNVLPLSGTGAATAGGAPDIARQFAPVTAPGGVPEICRCACDGTARWAVLAPPGLGLRVNGQRVRRFRVLRHRDSMWWPGVNAMYFSTERRLRVEPFPGAGQPTFCVRCKDAIETGQAAVSCPGCGMWHHEDAARERPCWTYGTTCASCLEHPTAMNAGLRWVPEQG